MLGLIMKSDMIIKWMAYPKNLNILMLIIFVHATKIVKLQKVHKDILKVIHMNLAVFWKDMIDLCDLI